VFFDFKSNSYIINGEKLKFVLAAAMTAILQIKSPGG